MKILLAIVLMLSSVQYASANFECSSALSDAYSVDSKPFQLNEFDVDADFESSPEIFARKAVERLYSNLDCEKSNAKERSIVRCSEIIKGMENSKVCYVQNNEGYFLISKDMMENINVLYNRWD